MTNQARTKALSDQMSFRRFSKCCVYDSFSHCCHCYVFFFFITFHQTEREKRKRGRETVEKDSKRGVNDEREREKRH